VRAAMERLEAGTIRRLYLQPNDAPPGK